MEMEWKLGGRYVFDEITTSHWRSPSCVLEVTIHKVCYPMTEQVICRVFEPFGSVEHVEVFVELNRVCARVVFQTKEEATEAYGALYGRYVYTGCCQLGISYETFQEPVVAPVTSGGSAISNATMSPKSIQRVATTASYSTVTATTTPCSYGDASSDFEVPTVNSEASASGTFGSVCSGLELGIGSKDFGFSPLGASALPPVPDTVAFDVVVGVISSTEPNSDDDALYKDGPCTHTDGYCIAQHDF